MVNLMKRLRKLQTLLDTRLGTGAAVLPSIASASKEFPAVTRLHLTYAQRLEGGHQGARHFWRKCLPRLKYHNPGVPMTVQQTTDQQGPAALSIYFAEKASEAAKVVANQKKVQDSHAPAADTNEEAIVLNIKDFTYQQIWDRVQAITNAQQVSGTAEDKEQLKRWKDIQDKSGADRQRVNALRQAKKDQERMLAVARGEVDKTKQV
ncbi:hypothetical protein PENANT_c021G09220 [Penicillium antarcticum]|uniref:Ribosomal protein/NADH dehydrogenase domain-containing protein n=1 Tax=Penicillium antarcticum TaxID=416450 RepID=A0A1V6PZU8_9EURO|nr:uncharacterized protein N7508_010849 [Penicillium antarcticum]KAJ5296028.1 hypothetical protein N7508_010849 [Penicillium antarcticum]OQD82574.1 hypothetical protein PENANT_c021G09220 [Penicillium antarcticum]